LGLLLVARLILAALVLHYSLIGFAV